MTIKLYYVGAKGVNFGDSINPIVFERIFGLKTEHSYPTFCDVIGTGSILQMMTSRQIFKRNKLIYFCKYTPKPVVTMGTGFMFDNFGQNFLTKTYRPIHPHVLRGKLSHAVLEKINRRQYTNVAYGDMGLIFSYLLEGVLPKKYALGIIPHNIDIDNSHIQKLLESEKNSVLINLKDDPMTVLKKISECESIVSSSLHGLIAADSLNIPNKRIKLSEHGHNDNINFKFSDYYSVFDTGEPDYVDFTAPCEDIESLYSALTCESINSDYRINFEEVRKIQSELLRKGKELPSILERVQSKTL